MTKQTVSQSITVRRLRTGVSIYLELTTNVALQQFIDLEGGGIVDPDWSDEENDAIRPIITPVASCTRTVTMQYPTWKYNGQELVFEGETRSDGYVMDTKTGLFAFNATTYALKIVGNLASDINYASDTIEYSCQCTVEGLEYEMTRTIEVAILENAGSSFVGALNAYPKLLNEQYTTSTLTATLHNVTSVQSFWVKWYRNYVSTSTEFSPNQSYSENSSTSGCVTTVTDSNGTIKIDRDDVNGGDNNNNETGGGGNLFIAQFYTDASCTTCVATASIAIADEADEYSLVLSYDGTLDASDSNSSVIVTAKIVDIGGAVAGVDADYTLSVLNANMEVARSVSGSQITVTNDDSYNDNDPIVVGEATYDLV